MASAKPAKPKRRSPSQPRAGGYRPISSEGWEAHRTYLTAALAKLHDPSLPEPDLRPLADYARRPFRKTWVDIDPDTQHLAIYLLIMNPERGPRRCPPEVFLMLSLLLAYGGGLSVNDNGTGWAGLRPWGGDDRHMLGRLVTDAKVGQLAKQNPQPDHHSQHPVNFTRTPGRSAGGERPAGTPRRDREDAIKTALGRWDANRHRAGFTVSRAEYESTLRDAFRLIDAYYPQSTT